MSVSASRVVLIPIALVLPVALAGCVSFGPPDDAAPVSSPDQDLIGGSMEFAVPESESVDPRDWIAPYDVGSAVTLSPSQSEQMNTMEVSVTDVPENTFAELVNEASQGTVHIGFDSADGVTTLDGQADLSALPGASFTLTVTMPGPVTDSNSPETSAEFVTWSVQGGETTQLWAQTDGPDEQNPLARWLLMISAAGIAAAVLAAIAVWRGWL